MLEIYGRSTLAAVICGWIAGAPVAAGTWQCDVGQVSVQSEDADVAELVCDAVAQAVPLFQRCNLPASDRPLRIVVRDDMSEGCVGVYHCTEGLIEVLSPQGMMHVRSEASAFADLQSEAFFRSVVVHELAHAAADDLPCPFEACPAAAEYIAYNLQVMSLSASDRAAFEARADLGRAIAPDEINAMILYMAPHMFIQKAWAHLSQRDDPCGYIGQIIAGQVVLDSGPM